jgi:dipeptidyl aminopeptidase/acylaminoacyl peptidase
MEYMTTDEMFFDNWEMGGAPWEKENRVAMKSFAGSPHLFVRNWDTPILIIHGEQDYRIPYTQALAAFNSAQLLGVPSKLLIFSSENHWVLSPQNGILWQREFNGWLDEWLKD